MRGIGTTKGTVLIMRKWHLKFLGHIIKKEGLLGKLKANETREWRVTASNLVHVSE